MLSEVEARYWLDTMPFLGNASRPSTAGRPRPLGMTKER